MTGPVRIAVLCGSASTPSSTERLLRRAAAHAEALGARVDLFTGERLRLPLYGTPGAASDGAALDLVASVAVADGLLLGSPCYHGSVSGLLKNALDHLEELRDRPAPYLDGRAVGCLVTGQGTQGPANALRTLRDIVHALRGWPTPLGITVDGPVRGAPADRDLEARLHLLAHQVVTFAQHHRTATTPDIAAVSRSA
ncbi:NADPH-dependent FMN reductase [Kitasatospora sp. NPDC048365]|uniref:NADPH-dependent FMN reductase n=1 Tax=Kitasatospora sp. NPDC048365 TaxID=3364050 RepID=UPI00371F4021